MTDIEKNYYQVDNRKYLEEGYGKEQWVQVCGSRDLNGAKAGFWCGLIDKENIESVFHDCQWDIKSCDSGAPGFEGNSNGYTYHANLLSNGLEPLLYYREFYGVKPDFVDISQEFILLNNLCYDSKTNSYWAVLDNGETEEVARYANDKKTICIKLKYLMKYSAAKQKALLLFFEIQMNFDKSISAYGFKSIPEETCKCRDLYYKIWGGDLIGYGHAYSILMGKKIIYPRPVEECGYWPYEGKRNFEDFIIGTDEAGNEVTYTCNPEKLSNYFGANPGAPNYLTPVFFKREVLQKYLSKPEIYEIKDGTLDCGYLWELRMDNHRKEYVVAYLGDLGRDLPENEQKYWKSYNVVGDGKLSEVSYARDFLGRWTKSNMEDDRFRVNYEAVNENWNRKFGWKLFLPLDKDDQYNLTKIRLPVMNNQSEFDQLVLSLVKILIDSLNEKELQKPLTSIDNLKGIGKLEAWFVAQKAKNYEVHIQFMRDLQELRSSGTGHRKGKSYCKIANKFALDSSTYVDAFENILRQSNSFLTYLNDMFLV